MMTASGKILCFVKITAIHGACFDFSQGCADVAGAWINSGPIATAEFSGTSAGNQD
jgi:hypothetical protein